MNTKKLNNFKVEVFGGNDRPQKPPRGKELFDLPFGQIFMASRKKSGKTTVIENILRNVMQPGKTHVHFFVPTIKKDKSYRSILKHVKDKGNPMSIHLDLFGKEVVKDSRGRNKVIKYNILEKMIKDMENGIELEPNMKTKEKKQKGGFKKSVIYSNNPLECKMFGYVFKENSNEQEGRAFFEKKPKKSNSKYEELDHLFIFDDCGKLLKNAIFGNFCRTNRHFRCKNLISSQHWNDVDLGSRMQLDYCLLFKGHRKAKLEQIYENLDCSVDFDDFLELYKFATADTENNTHNFMYVDRGNSQIRKNFDELIEI